MNCLSSANITLLGVKYLLKDLIKLKGDDIAELLYYIV